LGEVSLILVWLESKVALYSLPNSFLIASN
jgi:hypothetical protein